MRLPVVDNADTQRVAGMVAETQRVRVRLLWDDQRMRQTMAAAAGLDRPGKSMTAAAGLDKLGRSMAAARTVQLRPLFDTKKLVGPMFGGELQRAAQAMAEAHRASMRPAFDASKMIRAGLGGEKMGQMMAAAGLDKIAKIMADSYQVRVPLLFDTQKLVGPMFGGELQRIAQGMAGAYRVPVRPLFDVQGVAEVAQSILDAAIAVPSKATTGTLTVVDGSVPAKARLFPGLMDPWQQVRCWDLQDWITFLGFLVAVAALLVAIGQSRPQENGEPNTTTFAPSSTSVPTRPKSTRPLEGEKGRAPTVRPSPTSGSG
ncbi:MAG TPA: hypothetical protein VGK11_06855 [Actinomycetota bacterium]